MGPKNEASEEEAPRRSSGQGRDRTGDTRIFSPVLYQLSYLSSESLILTHSGPL